MAFARNSDLDIALGTGTWRGGASDGTTLWFVDAVADVARAFVAATRARDADKDIDLGSGVFQGGTSDGTTLWFVDGVADVARAFVAATRARDADKDIDLGSGARSGGASDGTTLWFIDNTNDVARAFVAATRARDADKDIDLGSSVWEGGASDGTTLWFIDDTNNVARAFVAATRARDADKDITDIPSGFLIGSVYADNTLWFTEPTGDTAIAWERVAALEAVPAIIEGELSGEVEAQAQLGQSPSLTAVPAIIDGDLSGEVVARAVLGIPSNALTAIPAIIEGGLSGEVVAQAALGEVPGEFPTVVDAEITVGEAAKWYSIIGSEGIGSSEGDLEVAPGFSIDRVWWNGSDFRLNRNPLGQRQDGDDNDFDEYFGEGGTGQLAHFYLVTDAGVAEIAVTSRRSIGPHYLNLTPDAASQSIIEAVSVGDTVRFVIGPAGLSFVEALEAVPAIIEGELSGEVEAQAQLGQAPALTAIPAIIDGELSGEVIAAAALGSPTSALTAVPAVIEGELSGEVVAAAALGEAPTPTEFPTVVDAQVTVGEAAKWYSIAYADTDQDDVPDDTPEDIGSFTGDLEIAPGFVVDRIWWTGADFRLNRNPLGVGQAGADNDFNEYFGPGGTGENAYVYVVTDSGVAEIAVTSRRSIGPHYLNLTPDADAQAIIESVSVGDTVRFIIGPAGLSFAPVLDQPAITVFGAQDSTINRGESTTLAWQVINAVSASIDHGVGAVPVPIGFFDVAPTQDTLYTLTVLGEDGTTPATQSILIEVRISAVPAVIEGELSGEVVAAASLGQRPALVAVPAIIDGQLSGEVVALATLGLAPSSPPLSAVPSVIDGDLSGEVVAAAALVQVPAPPALIAMPAVINGDLSGEVLARAILGVDPATISVRARARAEVFGLTGRKPIYALEISHPDIPDNIRVVNDTQEVTLEGNTYVALAFRPRLPQEKEGEIRQAGIEVDNVGRRMVEWVEASNGGRGATMRIMELVSFFS